MHTIFHTVKTVQIKVNLLSVNADLIVLSTLDLNVSRLVLVYHFKQRQD